MYQGNIKNLLDMIQHGTIVHLWQCTLNFSKTNWLLLTVTAALAPLVAPLRLEAGLALLSSLAQLLVAHLHGVVVVNDAIR